MNAHKLYLLFLKIAFTGTKKIPQNTIFLALIIPRKVKKINKETQIKNNVGQDYELDLL